MNELEIMNLYTEAKEDKNNKFFWKYKFKSSCKNSLWPSKY